MCGIHFVIKEKEIMFFILFSIFASVFILTWSFQELFTKFFGSAKVMTINFYMPLAQLIVDLGLTKVGLMNH